MSTAKEAVRIYRKLRILRRKICVIRIHASIGSVSMHFVRKSDGTVITDARKKLPQNRNNGLRDIRLDLIYISHKA